MMCKIVRFQNLMWRNIMKSTKNKKVYVLHYSIDIDINIYTFKKKKKKKGQTQSNENLFKE